MAITRNPRPSPQNATCARPARSRRGRAAALRPGRARQQRDERQRSGSRVHSVNARGTSAPAARGNRTATRQRQPMRPRYRCAAAGVEREPARHVSCSARPARRPPRGRTRRRTARPALRAVSSYSCGPVVSSACTAIRLPSWAARSRLSPQATRGQEAGAERVARAGRLPGSTSVHRPTRIGSLARAVDPGPPAAERGDPDADLLGHLAPATSRSCARSATPRTRC